MFKDRAEAGRLLAEKLLPYKSERPIILALPRGGVPVARGAAQALGAPLDTLVVRKIGAPFNPEFGVGALAPGDVFVFDRAALETLGLRPEDLEPAIAAEMREMERRIEAYESGSYVRGLPAKLVIIVDDGLATGVTARAAAESAKLIYQPERIIFAAPVCARGTAARLRDSIDEVICAGEVENLVAIGDWYQAFPQLTDEEVINYLKQTNQTV